MKNTNTKRPLVSSFPLKPDNNSSVDHYLALSPDQRTTVFSQVDWASVITSKFIYIALLPTLSAEQRIAFCLHVNWGLLVKNTSDYFFLLPGLSPTEHAIVCTRIKWRALIINKFDYKCLSRELSPLQRTAVCLQVDWSSLIKNMSDYLFLLPGLSPREQAIICAQVDYDQLVQQQSDEECVKTWINILLECTNEDIIGNVVDSAVNDFGNISANTSSASIARRAFCSFFHSWERSEKIEPHLALSLNPK